MSKNKAKSSSGSGGNASAGQRQSTWFKDSIQYYITAISEACGPLPLAITYYKVSTKSLSPVYGMLDYDRGITFIVLLLQTACVGATLAGYLLPSISPNTATKGRSTKESADHNKISPKRPQKNESRLLTAEQWLSVWPLWIPTIQHLFFKTSSSLPSEYSVTILQMLCFVPLFGLCTFPLLKLARARDVLSVVLALSIVSGVIPLLYGPFLNFFLPIMETLLHRLPSNFDFLSSAVGLELILGIQFATRAPSKLLVLALPAVLHTLFLNPHIPLHDNKILNQALLPYNVTVIDRQESNTGYISVLRDANMGFKVMRCDHSLLGGIWEAIREPVYPVFVMLEAVRLIRSPYASDDQERPIVPDNEAKALVIGLGIGITPAALIRHGIDTEIVELDPVVYKYAVEHFDLPDRHTIHLVDAVDFVAERVKLLNSTSESSTTTKSTNSDSTGRSLSNLQYDYIIHDVFTGGAEPSVLFTPQFIHRLRSLLKPHGVVAINYAGDLSSPPTFLAITTILREFPVCRLFREKPGSGDEVAEEKEEEIMKEFANLVVFCRNDAGAENGNAGDVVPMSFRKPNQRDLMSSISRQRHLFPRTDVEVMQDVFWEKTREWEEGVGNAGSWWKEPFGLVGWTGGGEKGRKERVLEQERMKGGMRHWRIMREVLPAGVWENW